MPSEPSDASVVPDEPAGAAAPDRGRPTLIAEFKDAVTFRAVLLVIGVAVVQLAFTLSCVGAFHRPLPYRMPLAVVAPVGESARIVATLNSIPGTPLQATAVAGAAAGTTELLRRDVYGVLVVGPGPGPGDVRLLEAGASGVSAAQAMTEVLGSVGVTLHRTVTVDDIRPPAPAPGDRNSLTSF